MDDRIAHLMQAARCGQTHAVKPLLAGLSPDVRDQTGRTALSWAASHEESGGSTAHEDPSAVVQLLLDQGADPNSEDHHGETPLHWAAKTGVEHRVQLLLQHHAQPDIADARGRTPLSRAAERGHDAVVRVLLMNGGADPDSKDFRGRTPLSWAAEQWHLMTVTTLLEHGASVDIHDNECQSPLWWFISNSAKRSILDQHPGQPQQDFQHWLALLGPSHGMEPLTKARRTFLSWACERGDKTLVQHLLQTTWADPNSIDRWRKTPLIYALEWNHYELADLLLSGAQSHKKKRDVVSLRIMVQEGRSRLLKPFFERYQSSLEDEDEYSSVPLVKMALHGGDRATVTVLLEYKASLQGIENRDWFGPCSTKRAAIDVLSRNQVRKEKGAHSSIPVMRMALHDGDRDALAALLDERTRMLELEDEDSFGQFGQYSRVNRPSVAVDIVALQDGRKRVQWIMDGTLDQEIRALPKTPDEVHLILFRENSVWKAYNRSNHTTNELTFSLGTKSPCRTFSLSVQMNLNKNSGLSGSYDDEDPSDGGGTIRTIEWAMLEAPPKTIHYFSNMPYGWIPQSDLELVQLFLQTWREDWMAFCRDARINVGQLRSHQLTARGKDSHLINAVAENMLQWTRIQGVLAEQLNQARDFVSQYQRFSETRKFSEQMNIILDALDRDVSAQIEKLEQTVRDLLQIEFAWVTINEAHRSTSLAASMKRISWITFIFLPLMFAASLLGMNVDVLKNDPSWRWYPLIGGVLLFLTVSVWVSSKFTNFETWMEKKTQAITRRQRSVPQYGKKDLVF